MLRYFTRQSYSGTRLRGLEWRGPTIWARIGRDETGIVSGSAAPTNLVFSPALVIAVTDAECAVAGVFSLRVACAGRHDRADRTPRLSNSEARNADDFVDPGSVGLTHWWIGSRMHGSRTTVRCCKPLLPILGGRNRARQSAW